MAKELNGEQKRDLIYVSERIKEIDLEKERLTGVLEGMDQLAEALDEAQKRYRIYATERLRRLDQERRAVLSARKALTG